MKHHLINSLSLLCLCLVSGCTNTNQKESYYNSDSATSEGEINSSMDEQIIADQFSDSQFESLQEDYIIGNTEYQIEVGKKLYLGTDLKDLQNLRIVSANNDIASISDDFYLLGKVYGKVTIKLISQNTYYQDIHVEVVKQNSLATSFPFNVENMYGKKMAVFGDSVSAQATIGEGKKTYSTLFKETFSMSSVKNYAIGGTTLTYTYPGSNIEKEYGNNTTAIDAVRVVTNAAIKNELDNLDYAIIAYGHNDQYFQPPLDSVDTIEGLSYENCVSYKASFRYVINMLRKKSPNIRIIILNCTYSEYDKTMAPTYNHVHSYADYRQASHEIATEFACRYIDPWDYLQPYFGNSTYYKDSVHLSEDGQKVLFDYVIQQ